MFHIFTAASCKQFQHNSINIRHDATPMMPAMQTPRCPSLHAVVRAHFHTVLQLQSQIHQGTSVREWNWLRKNHAGWLNGQTEYPLSFKRVPMNTITIIIILCAYAMRAGGGFLSVCDWPDNLFKLKTRAHFTFFHRSIALSMTKLLRSCGIAWLERCQTRIPWPRSVPRIWSIIVPFICPRASFDRPSVRISEGSFVPGLMAHFAN